MEDAKVITNTEKKQSEASGAASHPSCLYTKLIAEENVMLGPPAAEYDCSAGSA
jgi:hypothetical protein